MFRPLAYLKRTLVSILKRFFRKFGYEIVSDSSSYMTMDGGLLRLAERGIKIDSVIDVGASNGRWSEMCMKYFPNANYHLIEAQEEYGNSLAALKKKFPHLDYALKVAASETGDIYFDDHIVGGGIASNEKRDANFKPMQACTIDDEIKNRKLSAPFFIKLDTHGFEIPILEGATETLKQTNALVVECYNFQLNNSAKIFHEMLQYLQSKGFRCIDIVDLTLRKRDGVLWQMDIFFARDDFKAFESNSYE